jgi:purine-nucleoside phosphorylase
VSASGAERARSAATAVRGRLGVRAPAAAIVLGTGLGELAERIEGAVRVPYAEIPGFEQTTVEGHRGELIRGTLAGREVLGLAGRFHMYEGHSAQVAAFPVRVVHALGAPVLFVSNAAGGLRRTFRPGDLMIIEDHINLMWRNPLIGALEPGDDRFPDMSWPYAPRLVKLLREAARTVGAEVTSGVYVDRKSVV